MPEAGFILSDDFESYANSAAVFGVYGTDATGTLLATSGRDGTKGWNGTLQAQNTGTPWINVVVGFAYQGRPVALTVYGTDPLHGGVEKQYFAVTFEADGALFTTFGSVHTPMWDVNVARYFEAQFGATYLRIGLEGIHVFDFNGAVIPPGGVLTRFVFSTLMDDVYAREARTVGGTIDYVDAGLNNADFVGDYRTRHNTPLVITQTGTARVTQQFAVTAYKAPLPSVAVTQQLVIVARQPPKPTVRVTQQYIIVAIKNKPGARVRPQVFGVGRA